MKKEMLVVLLFIFSITFALSESYTTTVYIKLDIGTAAVLRIKDASTGSTIANAQMTNYNNGLSIANFSTNRQEVKFLILITKDGRVVKNEIIGPYETGGEINLDYRLTKPEEKNKSSSKNESKESSKNESKEKKEKNSTKTDKNNSLTSISGKAIFSTEDSGISKWVYISVSIIVIFAIALFLSLLKRKKFRNSREQDLKSLEEQLREKRERIERIKQRKKEEEKINWMKKELEKEEKELGKIEDLE